MPDDISLLQQQLADVRQRLDGLESRFPITLSGPVGNWLQAAQIGPGPAAKSSMHLNMMGNQAGVAPRLSVTDSAGVVRAEVGNLAVNGVSAAQQGFRANDAAGAPIFDSLGLISVMQSLGQTHIGGSAISITSTTPTVLTGSAITFSLARSVRVLVFGVVSAWITSGVNYGLNTIFLDAVDQATTAGVTNYMYCSLINVAGAGALTSSSAWCQTLAAGSHTFDIRGAINTGPGTMTIYDYGLYVFQLGA